MTTDPLTAPLAVDVVPPTSTFPEAVVYFRFEDDDEPGEWFVADLTTPIYEGMRRGR